MREVERDPGRIQDMLEAADYIISFVEGLTYEQFFADKIRYFAVMKNVEILGEAANMLTEEFRVTHSEIPWKQVIKMRHVLVHGYSNILPEILWETATQDVPQLKELLLKLNQ
jgi:uncharacterized protein with HEPN domain